MGTIKRILVRLLVSLWAIWSFGCSSAADDRHVIDPNAYLTVQADGSCEFNLRSSFLGRGEPGSLQLMRHRLYRSLWLYVPTRTGKWEAGQVILTTEWGKKAFPCPIQDLKGTIELTADRLVVNLQMPQRRNDDTIAGYAPFDENATYHVTANAGSMDGPKH